MTGGAEALVSSKCKSNCLLYPSSPFPLTSQAWAENFVNRAGAVRLIKSKASFSARPPLTWQTHRITLVFANVNPFCSKFNTSCKGSTITFLLLPTVYHSWIAKGNLCCDFSFAGSLLSIFKFVSRSSWEPAYSVGSAVVLGLCPSAHSVLWTSPEVTGGLCSWIRL